MRSALIISLNFNPGHVSHLVASCRQCEELGYEAIYYIHPSFVGMLPSASRYVVYERSARPKAELAVFLFPSVKNVLLIRSLKRNGTKIAYVFHEPLAPMGTYRDAGFSYFYLSKLWVANRVSAYTVKKSDSILLPSRRAVSMYESNALYRNPNYHYLPLMFDDERGSHFDNVKRKYFSYIGTVAADHSFYEYLRFVQWAVSGEHLSGLGFMIATKSEFDFPKELQNSGRVKILKGKPLSNEEINDSYASSFAVWNAYTRTTQSGVLAKSFMFGTPVIVLRKNLSEFTQDGKDVVAIDDNGSFEEIEGAIMRILDDFDGYSKNARNRFLSTFYYRNYNDQFRQIIESI